MTTSGEAAGIWLSISEIARRKGLHRDSVRERVDRLVAKGMITTRTEGRSRMVDLVAFDRAVGDAGDAVKEAAAETKREKPETASPKLRDAQTEKAVYEARLKALDLAERQGAILPIKGEHGAENAMARAGISIVREVEKIPLLADEIAVAVSKEGVTGAKRVLKEAVRQARVRIAEALRLIEAEGKAVETEGLITSEIGSVYGDD